jgi:predicted transcriptional regulator
MSEASKPVAFTSPAQLEAMKQNPGGNHLMWGEPMLHHDDVALYAETDVSALVGQNKALSMTAVGAEKEADEALETLRLFKDQLSQFSTAYDDGMEAYAAAALRDFLRTAGE